MGNGEHDVHVHNAAVINDNQSLEPESVAALRLKLAVIEAERKKDFDHLAVINAEREQTERNWQIEQELMQLQHNNAVRNVHNEVTHQDLRDIRSILPKLDRDLISFFWFF